MTPTMKAVVWDGQNFPQGLSYREIEVPQPPPGWALVHNLAAGICGSDLHYLQGLARQEIPDRNLPAVLGHENAGVVVETGAGVTRLRPGDRVAVEPLHGCTEFGASCPMCLAGKYNLCMSGVAHVGLPFVRTLPGGFGDYSIVHQSHLYTLPDSVTFEEASLVDILAVGVHAVNIGQPSFGDTVVVIGCGVIGLDLIQCLRLAGANIIAIARHKFQAEAARRLGAHFLLILDHSFDPVAEVMELTRGKGADQVYECVGGEGNTLNQAIAMCRMGGKVIMIGEFYGLRPTNLFSMMMKEIPILTSNAYSTFGTVREFEVALQLLAEKKVEHACLITHRFEPENYMEALETSYSKKESLSIKSIFVRHH
jgi:threonine dehydrogenase-like Zn-dependent dehydrogenase